MLLQKSCSRKRECYLLKQYFKQLPDYNYDRGCCGCGGCGALVQMNTHTCYGDGGSGCKYFLKLSIDNDKLELLDNWSIDNTDVLHQQYAIYGLTFSNPNCPSLSYEYIDRNLPLLTGCYDPLLVSLYNEEINNKKISQEQEQSNSLSEKLNEMISLRKC